MDSLQIRQIKGVRMTQKLADNPFIVSQTNDDFHMLVRLVIEQTDAVRAVSADLSIDDLVTQVENRLAGEGTEERWRRAPRSIDMIDYESVFKTLALAGHKAAAHSAQLGLPIAARPHISKT